MGAWPDDGWRGDVIAVLGFNNDTTHPITQARVDRGVELWRAGIAAFLLMTGRCAVRHLDNPPATTEAAAMRARAIAMGVPKDRILLEEHSVNTIGNAYWAKVETLLPRGWNRVAVVSTEGHAEVGAWLFERVCGPGYVVRAFPARYPDSGRRAEALERARQARQDYAEACAAFADGDHEAFEAALLI